MDTFSLNEDSKMNLETHSKQATVFSGIFLYRWIHTIGSLNSSLLVNSLYRQDVSSYLKIILSRINIMDTVIPVIYGLYSQITSPTSLGCIDF